MPARIAASSSLLDALHEVLRARGLRVLGPQREGDAIVIDDLASPAQLPWSLTDEQAPGRYRLHDHDAPVAFAHGPPAFSLRRLVSPPRETLVTLRRKDQALTVEEAPVGATEVAVLGARGCDLRALAAQDRVFAEGAHADERYLARRRDLFVVAVACHRPAATCACTSRGGDVRPAEGTYDLLLTELVDAPPRYLLEAGTERGREVLEALEGDAATDEDLARAEAQNEAARAAIDRALPIEPTRAALLATTDDAAFTPTADKCLGCESCTLVCPTCFCVTVEEAPSLDGASSDRVRRHDSCFSASFSRMHGGQVRTSIAGRYRHWMRHKLATWHGQWGLDGCVGCGRCTTWCPAGIDFFAEAQRIVEASSAEAAREETP